MRDFDRYFSTFRRELEPYGARVVAVSKTKPVADLQAAYAAGFRDFGENKVQEMTQKETEMPADTRWHAIGHLQTNKVKYLAPYVHLIHSVDSLKLLREINKQGQKHSRTIECLLQIHIAQEESKFGLTEAAATELWQHDEVTALENVCVVGLMGMATFTEDKAQIRQEFSGLRRLFETFRQSGTRPNVIWRELSMGMSNDYRIALEEGSTLIRVGSSIFGARA